MHELNNQDTLCKQKEQQVFVGTGFTFDQSQASCFPLIQS